MPDRTFLDWNATAPLRPEARAAMIAAMDVVGNPSSVHTEGRAAKMMMEKAREQVAALVECALDEIVFTSGATEAASLILDGAVVVCSEVEHDAVIAHRRDGSDLGFEVDEDGRVVGDWMADDGYFHTTLCSPNETATNDNSLRVATLQAANSETGVVQSYDDFASSARLQGYRAVFVDATQAVGKAGFFGFGDCKDFGVSSICLSAHKMGGTKGTGALVTAIDTDLSGVVSRGGGQEKGRRSGTENVIGIAGFGAAAEAAQRDLDAGAWEPIEELRNDLEAALRDCAGDDLTIFGESAPRLPNTSCFAIPGWKGETQVMQLDLAGFAVSAGSACSSGKVGPSRVLKAMGYDDTTASSAIRVSMGTTTTKDEVSRFIDAWTALYQRMKTRAA